MKFNKVMYVGLCIVLVGVISCKSKDLSLDEIKSETYGLELRIIELMEKADMPYSESEVEAEQLVEDIRTHYNRLYAHPNSEFAISQWNVLLSSEEETILFARYLDIWQKDGVLEEEMMGIGIGNVRLVLRSIQAAEARL